MTNEQILQKAIEKAKSNGWKDESDVVLDCIVRGVIFNHEFAKAFFGEESCDEIKTTIFSVDDDRFYDGLLKRIPNWQYHLQQMVLQKEPLKYLAKFI